MRNMRTIDSANAALSSDDILCEILLRLPPESVFRLIIVSKRWLQFICSSSFCHNYLSKWGVSFRLLGFFACYTLYLGRPRNGIKRPSSEPALPFMSTCEEGDDLNCSGILKQLGYFIDASNGLLLCGRHPKTYFVWNPITKQQQKLPHPRVHFEQLCMAFLVEDYPGVDMCYKVIRAKCECRDEVNTVTIETFNSKTTTWNYSTLTCSSALSLCSWTVATVVKGVVHWFAQQGNLAIYDPSDGDRCIDLIKLPGSSDFDERVLGESSDQLLQYGWSNHAGMEIWVLVKEQGDCATSSMNIRWRLRHRVNFKIMWKKNTKFMMSYNNRRHRDTQILSFLPRNSESVFIKCELEVFLYHFPTEKAEMVRYQGRVSTHLWDFSKVVPYFRPSWPHSSLC